MELPIPSRISFSQNASDSEYKYLDQSRFKLFLVKIVAFFPEPKE